MEKYGSPPNWEQVAQDKAEKEAQGGGGAKLSKKQQTKQVPFLPFLPFLALAFTSPLCGRVQS